MSTAGSVRSGASAQYTPESQAGAPGGRGRNASFFRWQGILPISLAVLAALGGWALFGDAVVRDSLSEAGTKAFGAQLDIASVRTSTLAATIELRGIALADPFDRDRNLFEAGRLVLELETRPLLERKFVVRRLSIGDVRTNTHRATPARAVGDGGLAPRAMAEVRRFAAQFDVPMLSLRAVGELKDVILDPSQLKAVQAASLLARRADSTKDALETTYADLRLRETIDSSSAVLTRLQGTSVRTLGIDGARRAIADIRRVTAGVDSARARVDDLVMVTRRGVDSLQAGVAGIEAARRQDYQSARDLLKLPTFEGPDMGAALFGRVTIDRFQRAVYWATLARRYAPPGLLPRESEGPKRMRLAGATVRFATPRSYPRFLLKRANVEVTVSGGPRSGRYVFGASDVTTDPAIVGRPTLFALRRVSQDGRVDSIRATASIDHVGPRRREAFNVHASGAGLPIIPIPTLPYFIEPGRGTTEIRFALDGDRISGRWVVRSDNLAWRVDSARARPLNAMETLVARVLTGIRQLDLVADVGGSMTEPTLSVRSNLDRQIADRIKAVAGEEIAAAQARLRAQVDRHVDEKSASVKARIADVRAEGDRRVADARARLDEEKRKLEARLKGLSGGLGSLPRFPGD